MSRAERFVSAQTLHRELVGHGDSVSLSTVYRGLHDLDPAAVQHHVTPGGETLYRLRRSPDEEVITCRRCGSAAAVDIAPVRAWAAVVGATHGFTGVEVRLHVTGLCRDCRANRGL